MAKLVLKSRHRVMCGDSTSAQDVEHLMAGDAAVLLVMSPRYAQQRDYGIAKAKVSDWDALMRGVFGAAIVTPDAQILVNLGLVHRDNEWVPYWETWIEWMRQQGWRRFGWYVWDQGPGLPGDWSGRLSPAFEFLFHFNRQARKPNKIVPCKWAGHINESHVGMRAKDGTVGEWSHAGSGVQDMRIPDNVLRITRHKARGIETEHPAVFPVALPEFVLNAYSQAGDVVFEPFGGSGTQVIAAERSGRRCFAMEIDPAYVDVACRRWRLAIGTEPVHARSGKTYSEMTDGAAQA